MVECEVSRFDEVFWGALARTGSGCARPSGGGGLGKSSIACGGAQMFSRCILVGRMVRDPEFRYIRKSRNTLALNSLID